MSCLEQQEEEKEVLLSIYEGDANFIHISDCKYQYKVTNEADQKTFLIEVEWQENYPDEIPLLNMDIFYNEHLLDCVKKDIIEKLKEEAENGVGMAMTYTLFEYAKDHASELLANQTDKVIKKPTEAVFKVEEKEVVLQKKDKQDVMTKGQKRRMYDKFGTKGMQAVKPRGWDWVDLVKHLSQTGAKDD